MSRTLASFFLTYSFGGIETFSHFCEGLKPFATISVVPMALDSGILRMPALDLDY
jgi:hypothetical protein